MCKRTPTVVAEALECLGGNGYVEEWGCRGCSRDSPFDSIWEGSGNVIALDVVRALRRDPASVDALFAELARTAGVDDRLDAAVAALRGEVAECDGGVGPPRRRPDRPVPEASLLLRAGSPAVAAAFVATRIAAEPPAVAGERDARIDTAAVLDHAEVR